MKLFRFFMHVVIIIGGICALSAVIIAHVKPQEKVIDCTKVPTSNPVPQEWRHACYIPIEDLIVVTQSEFNALEKRVDALEKLERERGQREGAARRILEHK